MFGKLIFGISVAVLLVAWTPAASANDARLARDHYDRGTKLFDLQRYTEAVKEYEEAYELHDDPALLYNIAQAARLAGQHTKAIGAYKSFIRRSPKIAPEDLQTIQARIEELKKLQEAQKSSQEKPPTGTKEPLEVPPTTGQKETPKSPPSNPIPPPPPPIDRAQIARDAASARTMKIAGLATTGVGVVALALSGAFAGLAKSANDTLNTPKMGQVFDSSLEKKVTTYQNAEFAMIAVGGVAVVSGVVVTVLGFRKANKARLELTPSVAPGAASLSLSGSF